MSRNSIHIMFFFPLSLGQVLEYSISCTSPLCLLSLFILGCKCLFIRRILKCSFIHFKLNVTMFYNKEIFLYSHIREVRVYNLFKSCIGHYKMDQKSLNDFQFQIFGGNIELILNLLKNIFLSRILQQQNDLNYSILRSLACDPIQTYTKHKSRSTFKTKLKMILPELDYRVLHTWRILLFENFEIEK